MKKIKQLFLSNLHWLMSLVFLWSFYRYGLWALNSMSGAYVSFLEYSIQFVGLGVLSYLIENFKFFMVTLVAASVGMCLLMWAWRWALVKLYRKLPSPEKLHAFSDLCNFVMNFLISVGLVFLFGIKDNFFNMYYELFESGMSVSDSAIDGMSYDIFLNWVFCEILIIKMFFELFFSKEGISKSLGLKEKKQAEEEPEEAAEEKSAEAAQ